MESHMEVKNNLHLQLSAVNATSNQRLLDPFCMKIKSTGVSGDRQVNQVCKNFHHDIMMRKFQGLPSEC